MIACGMAEYPSTYTDRVSDVLTFASRITEENERIIISSLNDY